MTKFIYSSFLVNYSVKCRLLTGIFFYILAFIFLYIGMSLKVISLLYLGAIFNGNGICISMIAMMSFMKFFPSKNYIPFVGGILIGSILLTIMYLTFSYLGFCIYNVILFWIYIISQFILLLVPLFIILIFLVLYFTSFITKIINEIYQNEQHKKDFLQQISEQSDQDLSKSSQRELISKINANHLNNKSLTLSHMPSNLLIFRIF